MVDAVDKLGTGASASVGFTVLDARTSQLALAGKYAINQVPSTINAKAMSPLNLSSGTASVTGVQVSADSVITAGFRAT